MTTWADLPDGVEDIREAFAADLDRMGLTPGEECECGADITDRAFAPWPRPLTGDVHDNGADYRA